VPSGFPFCIERFVDGEHAVDKRRVVVTGIGVVSPIGCNLQDFWKNLVAGQGGIGLIQGFDAAAYDAKIAAEIRDFPIDNFIAKKEQRRMDRFCHLGIAAAKMAMDDAAFDRDKIDPTRMGTIVGSGIGGLGTLESQHTTLMEKGPGRCSPFMIPQMIVNMASGLIAIEHNLQGPNFCVVSACASAAHSIGDALRIIQRDEADVMVAGGAEASVTSLAIAGFAAMKALSTRNDDPKTASRPFDRERDGFVMGEGAAILVLEEYEHAKARGAQIYCEIAGFGQTCDAYHMTAPMDEGIGATRSMVNALRDAGRSADSVDYINAHGTSTPLNDKIETRAIKGALGAHAHKVAISSTKSMTGHLLGAAAGVEAVACAMAIKHGIVPPTINQINPDPDCDLDYVPNVARELPVSVALNNSLGFGGHNACICMTRV
jgi:3-oxoacyl-[acyl-carrier-protein] synthase II